MNGSPLTILLVEDNVDHAELIKRSLGEFHVVNRLRHVETGEAALDYIRGRGQYADRRRFPTPDLILLDLRLPRMDGLEVLRAIKTDPRHTGLPVVILTTSNAERDVAQAYECRANGYLTKPVDPQRFTALLKDLGYYWLASSEFPCHNEGGPGEPIT